MAEGKSKFTSRMLSSFTVGKNLKWTMCIILDIMYGMYHTLLIKSESGYSIFVRIKNAMIEVGPSHHP